MSAESIHTTPADVQHDQHHQHGQLLRPPVPIKQKNTTSMNSSLARGLQIASNRSNPTSGFRYPEQLQAYQISQEQWDSFICDITRYVQVDPRQSSFGRFEKLVICALSFLLFSLLGLVISIPVIILIDRHKDKEIENQNLQSAIGSPELSTCLSHWNEKLFNLRGLQVRLEAAGDTSDIFRDDMDLYTQRQMPEDIEANEKARTKWLRRIEKKKLKAMQRGRIVIVPLGNSMGKHA